MTDFNKLDLSTISDIQYVVSTNADNTILHAKFSGKYAVGSAGNNDGIFMRATLASCYFAIEPISLILDLSELQYEWGNTIFDCLNFFDVIGRDADEKQKLLVVVTSEVNHENILKIDSSFNSGNRLVTSDLDKALLAAKKYVQEYLN